MKKVIIFLLISIIFIAIIFGSYKFLQIQKDKKESELLLIAEEIVNSAEDTEIEIITKEELELNDNVVGIIEIPKLNIKAPIREGTTQSILKNSVGHFSNSSLWNGNVAIASHNRGNCVAHYFENINKLTMGDEIIYKTKFGERGYKVISNKKIESTDWSVISQTKENILTLITCVKNKPKLRLCVQAIEK